MIEEQQSSDLIDIDTLEALRCKSFVGTEQEVSLSLQEEKRKALMAESAKEIQDMIQIVHKIPKIEADELSRGERILYFAITFLLPFTNALVGASQTTKPLLMRQGFMITVAIMLFTTKALVLKETIPNKVWMLIHLVCITIITIFSHLIIAGAIDLTSIASSIEGNIISYRITLILDLFTLLAQHNITWMRFRIEDKIMILQLIINGVFSLFVFFSTAFICHHIYFNLQNLCLIVFYLILLSVTFWTLQEKRRAVEHRFQNLVNEINEQGSKVQRALTEAQEEVEKPYKNFNDKLTESRAELLLKKLKYLRFQLMIESQSAANGTHVDHVRPGIRTPTGKSKSPRLYRKLMSRGSFINNPLLLGDTVNGSPRNAGRKDNLALTTQDVDAIIEIIVSKDMVAWMPAFFQEGSGEISKEATEFLMNHFTEQSAALLATIPNTKNLDKLQAFSPVKEYLLHICTNWNIDFFRINRLSQGNALFDFGLAVFDKFNLVGVLDVGLEIISTFLKNLQNSYNGKNPYHNSLHAADVANSIGFFLVHGLRDKLSHLETCSLVVSALAHDVGHPGLNNAFMVATKSDIALIYNDQSVLENFHLASFFKIMSIPRANILDKLTEKEYRYFRKLSISMILDTDLQKHFIITNKFKNALSIGTLNLDDEVDKLQILSVVLKCADIGHGAREIHLHQSWSRRVIEEFWRQGDVEMKKNLPPSPLCDRRVQNVAKSQEGFLKAIVLPLYEAYAEFIKEPSVNQACVEQIRKNVKYWNEEAEREASGNGTFFANTHGIVAEIDEMSSLMGDQKSHIVSHTD